MQNAVLAKYIDHTALKPETTPAEIEKLCREAKDYNFYAVCVNPCYVAEVFSLLRDSEVKTAAVIGFPLGANATATKIFETELALQEGATEIDMVINIGALKAGNYEYVRTEIEQIFQTIKQHDNQALLKVIIETGLLSSGEIARMCELLLEIGVDFVKTSTGFSGEGAKIEDIRLMKDIVGEKMKIKASGGIRDREAALAMIAAGADRIGSSNGIKIVG